MISMFRSHNTGVSCKVWDNIYTSRIWFSSLLSFHPLWKCFIHVIGSYFFFSYLLVDIFCHFIFPPSTCLAVSITIFLKGHTRNDNMCSSLRCKSVNIFALLSTNIRSFIYFYSIYLPCNLFFFNFTGPCYFILNLLTLYFKITHICILLSVLKDIFTLGTLKISLCCPLVSIAALANELSVQLVLLF